MKKLYLQKGVEDWPDLFCISDERVEEIFKVINKANKYLLIEEDAEPAINMICEAVENTNELAWAMLTFGMKHQYTKIKLQNPISTLFDFLNNKG